MKEKLKRITSVIIAMFIGALIFIALIFAGDSSKGPLEDFMSTINTVTSSLEKSIMGDRDTRQNKLKWFEQRRNNVSLLKAPDTLIFGAYDDRTFDSFQPVVSLEDSLNFSLPLIQIYSAWGSKGDQAFPRLRAQAIYDLGSVPMITWEPWLEDFNPGEFPFVENNTRVNRGGMKAVAEGEFDRYIDEWAESAKKFRQPFFLRFGHEMNDPYRYPWGPQNNAPQDYVKAWQHVVNRFKKAGAENAIWIWSPHPAYAFEEYYPGNKYVDWTGLTALNYGTLATWSEWYSFEEIVKKPYNQLSEYEHPVMVTEFGSLEVGGDRAQWYHNALDSIAEKYPFIHSVVFFNASADNTTSNKTLDWTITNDKPVLEAIKQAVIK